MSIRMIQSLSQPLVFEVFLKILVPFWKSFEHFDKFLIKYKFKDLNEF